MIESALNEVSHMGTVHNLDAYRVKRIMFGDRSANPGKGIDHIAGGGNMVWEQRYYDLEARYYILRSTLKTLKQAQRDKARERSKEIDRALDEMLEEYPI